MLRRMVICLIIVGAGALFAASSSARERRHIDATPFLYAPCSVFNHGPCIPEFYYPYGENLQVTIHSQPSQDDATKYQKPDHDLNTIGDLFAALRSCWSPPPADIRNTYLKAINASLSGCEPFKFTAGLGDAIAGRPIMIRYVDNRDLEKQSGAR